MRECQSAHKTLPKLWIIHYVEVCAVSKNSVDHEEKSRIVEEDANLHLHRCYWYRVLDTGKIPPANKHKDIKGGCGPMQDLCRAYAVYAVCSVCLVRSRSLCRSVELAEVCVAAVWQPAAGDPACGARWGGRVASVCCGCIQTPFMLLNV